MSDAPAFVEAALFVSIFLITLDIINNSHSHHAASGAGSDYACVRGGSERGDKTAEVWHSVAWNQTFWL